MDEDDNVKSGFKGLKLVFMMEKMSENKIHLLHCILGIRRNICGISDEFVTNIRQVETENLYLPD